MSTRDAPGSVAHQIGSSPEPILSPCETYEGSRHYTVFLGDEVEVDGADASSRKTVIMSPVLLAQLREQALRDLPPDSRPTRRSMPAVRPEDRSGPR